MEANFNNFSFKLKHQQEYSEEISFVSSGYCKFQDKNIGLLIKKTEARIRMDLLTPDWGRKVLELSWRVGDLMISLHQGGTELLYIGSKHNFGYWLGHLDMILSVGYFNLDRIEMSTSYQLLGNSKMFSLKVSQSTEERFFIYCQRNQAL